MILARTLLLGLLSFALAACQRPAVPPAPSASGAPSAPTMAEPPQAEPAPLPTIIPAATHFEPASPGPSSGKADVKLDPIDLPANVTLDTDNSDDDNLAIYAALKKLNGLRFVYGSGTRRVVLFSDPGSLFDLGLFQMLEANADNLDATVIILPYVPADQPASRAKVSALFCAQSPERAWRSWMLAAQANTSSMFQTQGRIPEAAWQGWSRKEGSDQACSPRRQAELDQIQSVGDRLSLTLTPRAVFANGQAWPGPIMDRTDLEKIWWYVHGHLKIEG